MSIVDQVNVGGLDFDVQDTKTKAVIAPTETTDYASKAYAVKDHFIWADNKMYEVTAAITSGSQFIVGTNVRLVNTVSGAIKQAVADEASIRASAISAETNARTASDATINTRIDQIVAPTGEAPNPAEITDARIGADDTIYTNLGTAIRTQFNEVNDVLVPINDDFYSTKDITASFMSGGINSNHNVVDNNARIITSSTKLPKMTGRDYIECLSPNAYAYKVMVYNANRAKGDNYITTLYGNQWISKQRVFIPNEYDGKYFLLLIQKIGHESDDISSEVELMSNVFKYVHCVDEQSKFRGYIHELGYTSLLSCDSSGWYGCSGSYISSIEDLPSNYPENTAFDLLVRRTLGDGSYYYYYLQELKLGKGNVWRRVIRKIVSTNENIVYRDWSVVSTSIVNRKIIMSILGDSTMTHGNSGIDPNAYEMTITEEDVGVSLSAYLTYYDVNNQHLSLGGHTFLASEIGTEVTFTPLAEDVGKSIGEPNNYNSNDLEVCWWLAKEELGFDAINVSWSGSSITSHEKNTLSRATSWGWHPSQIRKLGKRIPGTMDRIAPDIVLIKRGGNDYSHTPYAVVNENVFNTVPYTYPTDDEISSGVFGFKSGLILTINKIREAYPKAIIFLCTAQYGGRVLSQSPDGVAANNGQYSRADLNKAIREVADLMHCDIIDTANCGITEYNRSLYTYGQSDEYTHLNQKGHNLMANKMISELKAKLAPYYEW